jgi:beta-glucosidase
VYYGERVFVGYRFYETVDVPVRYPFGHGLSYTTFEYGDIEVSKDGLRADVTVTNTGGRAGSEVIQLYVAAPKGPVDTPVRELRAFSKVTLEAGASARVRFRLDRRAYSYFDVDSRAWVVAGGKYRLQVGRSASDIVLSTSVKLRGPKAGKLTLDSSVSDFLKHPVTGPIFTRAAAAGGVEPVEGGSNVLDMVSSMPMRRLMRFPGVGDSFAKIGVLIKLANLPVVHRVADWVQERKPKR